ncbi:MAG: hypothetical protein Q7J57_02295 [Gemmobacter sp.]|nr:hypothetical protein [Gemmobacter sp.]
MTDPKPAATVTGDAAILLTGTRIPGVTCPAILLADGTEVGLSHLPSDLPIGARIEVAGSGYVVSMTCQARVLAVTSAKRVDD